MPKSVSDLPNTEVKPNPSLEKRRRRTFTADYKLRIVTEAETCKHGELGAMLRRENLYSNQLADWRREYAENGFKGLSKSIPGPAASKTPEQKEIEKLKKENNKLTHELNVANDCLELQKKALSILDHFRNGNNA